MIEAAQGTALSFRIALLTQKYCYSNEGEKSDEEIRLYEKKISGSSKNVNTFALELKTVIEQYEKRLSDVNVTMAYIREVRKIVITIKGVISHTGVNYQHVTELKTWN